MMIFRMFNFMNSRMDEYIEEKRDIQQILDEQLLLQDLVMPQQQYKLLNYIKDHPEHLEQLIEYIVEINDEQTTTKQQYKYPFLASEILSKENDFFQEFLFEEQNQHFLNRLFMLLNEDSLNLTQAGYFSKIVLTLLRKKHSKVLLYLNSKDLSNLLKHIDISHIAEIIEKILLPNSDDNQELLKQKDLLQRVMKIAMHRYYEVEVFDNCMQILINLIKSPINQYQIELVEIILNPYFFLTICYQSQRTTAYELVSSLLSFINNTGKVEQYLGFVDVAKHISHALNTSNPFAISHETTYGDVVIALSSNKLILLQIYYQLLLSEKEEILNELIQNNSFKTVTEIILSHQHNNQALIWYDKIVTYISQKLPTIFEQNQQYLQDTIIKYNRNEKQQIGKLKNKINPSYQGVFTKISNQLDNNNEQWIEYQNTTLSKINAVEQKLLCDVDPKPKQNQQLITDSYHEIQQEQQQQEQQRQDENEYADEYEEEDDKENQDTQEENQQNIEQDNQEEKFYDCNEEGQQQQAQEKLKHKLSAEEQEQIEEQIEEIIQDPQTRVEDVAQLIDTEDKLEFEMDPVHLEQQLDNQVNTFFKAHEEKE